MNREDLITELKNRGYNVQAHDVTKNGVVMEAIQFHSGNTIEPVIYTEPYITDADRTGKTVAVVVDAIIDCYHQSKGFDFDANLLSDRDFILNHLYVAMQRKSNEDLVFVDCHFDDIEAYVVLRCETEHEACYSIKMTHALLEHVGISEILATNTALKHTFAEAELISMCNMLKDMLSASDDDFSDEDISLYVLTNSRHYKGASAILNREKLLEFGKKFNADKIVCIPSSIHEWLLLPYREGMCIDYFNDMIQEVNMTQVEPCERLGEHAVIFTV
ncbi:MAG: DUF5688 family protein [Lachnospiraceae bacterium]|nr:DUF5688 family protein [Lachnospiraceae bacterium]